MENLVKNIKEKMKEKRWSVKAIEEEIGYPRGTLSVKFARSKKSGAGGFVFYDIMKLTEILECSWDDLCKGVDFKRTGRGYMRKKK